MYALQERDALQVEVTETEALIEKQKLMIEQAEEAVKAARASADVAVNASKEKMAAIQFKELEIVAVRRRMGAITNLFSLQREAQAISAGLARTRESILPSPLVISGPSGAGACPTEVKFRAHFAPPNLSRRGAQAKPHSSPSCSTSLPTNSQVHCRCSRSMLRLAHPIPSLPACLLCPLQTPLSLLPQFVLALTVRHARRARSQCPSRTLPEPPKRGRRRGSTSTSRPARRWSRCAFRVAGGWAGVSQRIEVFGGQKRKRNDSEGQGEIHLAARTLLSTEEWCQARNARSERRPRQAPARRRPAAGRPPPLLQARLPCCRRGPLTRARLAAPPPPPPPRGFPARSSVTRRRRRRAGGRR